jgi:hypothetical protein
MRNDLRLGQLLRIEPNRLVCHRLSTAENVSRHGSGRNGSVRVMNIANIRYIRDIRNIRHVPDIGHIDHIQVIAAVVIPRKERFCWTQWEPAHQADTNANRKSRPSQEGNESRRINRCHDERTGQPSPVRPNEHPPSKVEWAKTPRLIFNPSPTPRIDPHPMTQTIWDPAHSDRRKPNRSIFGNLGPISVFVKIVKTRRGRIYIFGGS